VSPEAFCYWLQGLLEGNEKKSLGAQQVTIIREHLDLVFTPATKAAIERAEKAQEDPRGTDILAEIDRRQGLHGLDRLVLCTGSGGRLC